MFDGEGILDYYITHCDEEYDGRFDDDYIVIVKIPVMTDKQRDLILAMNEFCREKCPLYASKKDASAYISRNIEEYKLLTLDSWCLSNGYF